MYLALIVCILKVQGEVQEGNWQENDSALCRMEQMTLPGDQGSLKKHCVVAEFFQGTFQVLFFEFMDNKWQQTPDLHKYLNTVVSYQYVK